ncbi:MAG: DUF4012 domain-containing protein, partial [Candidatus Dojkabacteria bacterium]|nr:DUF4012 domain-containing protein [Candidatus Dojkabacteria bacterium]
MKSNQPTTLIVYGANTVGLKLSELLTAQHSAVLVLDEFTKSARDTIKQLKAGHVEVYDLSAIPSLTQKIQRLDYICILLDQFLTGISAVPGKRFLEESNNIDAVLKLAIQQGSKVILTTSIELHRKIAEAAQRRIGDTLSTKKGDSFNHIELQRYAENLAAEYHDQTSLDIRIARIGELMGEGISLEAKSPFMQMLKESVTKPRIIIPGEGLDYSYYIHYLDAVYGIVKAIFSSKTNGEVFSLSFPDEISTLNLAYKILEFNPHAQEIAFGGAGYESPPHQVYVPAKNLSKIGWTPKIPFEKALHETLDFVHKQYNVTWKNKPEWKTFEDAQDSALKTGTPVHRAEIATPFGKLLSAFSAPIGRIKDKILESVTSLRKAGGQPRFTLKLLIGSALSMLVFLFIVSPLLQVLVGGVGAYHYGKKAAGQGLAMNSEDAQESLDNMSFYVDLVSSGWRGLKWADHIPPAHNFYSQTARIVLALEHLSTGSSFLVDGLDPYIRYVRDFQPITSFGSNAGGGSREYQNELEAIESTFPSIERANVEITLAREALVGIDRTVYPPSLVKYIDELTKRTDEAGEMLSILEQFGTFVPEILGKDERKTYIVLFQNPMELRSTGGWLTSVAKVGIEHGQIRELEVKDVYDIDSRIPETVQPPESLSEVLNVDSWTVSLSNWSPDFPQSAEAAEYLLQEAGTITNADGVIMVDLEFVRSLLDVWGTVSVAGETEPVTADNLYDKVVEIHREFTPGSTRKPVFLSNLAN